MKVQKILLSAVMLLLGNMPLIASYSGLSGILTVMTVAVGGLLYLLLQIIAGYERKLSFRMKVLSGGYSLLWSAACTIVAQIILTVMELYVCRGYKEPTLVVLFSCLITLLLSGISACNGAGRIILASGQLKLIWKMLLLFTMWIPLWNLLLVAKACHIVKKEYMIEAELQDVNRCRKEQQICKTKYPIVMVHGIFFRDWQLMNYWGRIPYELKKNGAEVFYGRQESALPVSESAKEVREHILDAIQKTGASKVNVIAHSKGGLDTRYAISVLGMDQYVASLTTVNTPHQGCAWAEGVLKKLPQGFIYWVAAKYNKIFTRLGDKRPDFYNAVQDLTAARCKILNQQMPDKEGIYYQSVASVMKNRSSAAFPLNLVYPIVKKQEGDNDGLVAVPSAVWGNFLGVLSCKEKRGISHADMIDLTRENIPGFNVREYYIDLVKCLKERGF